MKAISTIRLSIVPAPDRIAIAPGRYYIKVSNGELWTFIPFQFTETEAQQILPHLQRRKTDWTLKPIKCTEFAAEEWITGTAFLVKADEILRVVESLLTWEEGGKAA